MSLDNSIVSLSSWSSENAFFPQSLAEYHRCFCSPETIHSTCEDYRASASIDLEHDQLDANQKIRCPVLVLWGEKGVIERQYPVLDAWRAKASQVLGHSLDCGHFLPEEAPEATYQSIMQFL